MELKYDLSQLLQTELNSHLAPGEIVIICLPGSFGEAFAASDRRAFVIREHETGSEPGCDVFAYGIDSISSATALATGTGGYIELASPEAKDAPEKARVYFPSYDLDKFKAAAEIINKMVASRPSAAHIESVAAPIGTKCPKCGASNPSMPYCKECGELVGAICAHCGSGSHRGASFCSSCGKSMIEFNTTCPTCGARVSRWQAYCTDCGSVLQTTCATCGGSVLPNYKRCPNCGRAMGRDNFDPHATAAAQRKIAHLQANAAQTESAEPPAAIVSDISEAEAHNKRGQDLFGADDVEAAIKEFREAVRLEPGNASFHCNLAIALDDNGDDEEALAEYQKTLQLDPKDLTALLSLGCMYNENEQPQQAAEAWNRVIEIAPLSAEAQEARDNLKHLQEI